MRADSFTVSGLRVVVTGGTAGIGLAVAEHLVHEGAHVVVTGRRAGGEAIGAGIGGSFVRVDVTDDESVRSGLDAAASLLGGGIDVLVLNAGIDEVVGRVDNMDLDAFRRVLDVNLGGVVRGLRFGVPHMPTEGSVIVTSSPASRVSVEDLAAYSASKAAVDSVVRTAAIELAAKKIRVNAVLPGVIRTEMTKGATGDGEWIAQLTASGAIRQPQELAPVYQFLASAASGTLTGATLEADDGLTAGISSLVVRKLV